jgi:hypothetical protein
MEHYTRENLDALIRRYFDEVIEGLDPEDDFELRLFLSRHGDGRVLDANKAVEHMNQANYEYIPLVMMITLLEKMIEGEPGVHEELRPIDIFKILTCDIQQLINLNLEQFPLDSETSPGVHLRDLLAPIWNYGYYFNRDNYRFAIHDEDELVRIINVLIEASPSPVCPPPCKKKGGRKSKKNRNRKSRKRKSKKYCNKNTQK